MWGSGGYVDFLKVMMQKCIMNVKLVYSHDLAAAAANNVLTVVSLAIDAEVPV